MCANYPSDLTDEQWQLIDAVAEAKKRGRPPIDRREVIDAILYVNRTGCQWRQLPRDFPKWNTVYTVFWRWRKAVCGSAFTKPAATRSSGDRQKEHAEGGDHR